MLASIMSNCVSVDLRRQGWCQAMLYRGLSIGLFHIADESLPAVVHMDVLDTDKLLAATTQASKDLNLGCISPHQTSRRRSEGDNSLL